MEPLQYCNAGRSRNDRHRIFINIRRASAGSCRRCSSGPLPVTVVPSPAACRMYVYYYRTYEKAVIGGGRGKREDMC